MRLLLAVCISFALFALPLVAASDAVDSTAKNASGPTQDDLDRAARTYRITVYNTFRRDRAEFDRRNATWRAIEAKWKADGSRPDELPALVAWLERATATSREGTVRALPQTPQSRVAQAPRVRTTPPATEPKIEPAVPPLERPNVESPLPARITDTAKLPEVPLPISPSIAAAPRPAVDKPAEIESPDDAAPRRPAPAVKLDAPAVASLPSGEVMQREPVESDIDGIDVDEVAIRIAGHNLALATLSEEIRNSGNPTTERLAALVERLEGHAVRAGDLSPYYGLVGESDRDRLRPLASLDEPRRLLDEKISQAIANVSADTTISSASQTEQLARLEELGRRIKQLDSTTP
jgi:hypothetical protein